jgi:hypothetical protein
LYDLEISKTRRLKPPTVLFTVLFVCCTRDTRPITETAQERKENTKIHAETTARRPIKEQSEATKTQALKTKLMKINIREYYKNKDQGDTIKILKEKSTDFEVNTWPFTA